MEYTKGDWKVDETLRKRVILNHPNWSDDKKVIADCNQWLNSESEANAQLISSAPDLYEAGIEIRDNAVLQEQENGYYLLRLSYASWKVMCKALAKAEGK